MQQKIANKGVVEEVTFIDEYENVVAEIENWPEWKREVCNILRSRTVIIQE